MPAATSALSRSGILLKSLARGTSGGSAAKTIATMPARIAGGKCCQAAASWARSGDILGDGFSRFARAPKGR